MNLTSCEMVVRNCTIEETTRGIDAFETRFIITDCNIQNNFQYGIYANFNSNDAIYESQITNSSIHSNESDGIYLYAVNSAVTLLNNLIFRNGQCGIYTYSPSAPPDLINILNNTVSNNGQYGIYRSLGTIPVITSCIVWGNNDDLFNCSTTYSCIEDDDSGTGNIYSDPCFFDADNNDFHLTWESNCIDAGDPNFIEIVNKTDFDGESRVMFGKTALRVDIGADEYYRPKADFNMDDIVDFVDFACLAPA